MLSQVKKEIKSFQVSNSTPKIFWLKIALIFSTRFSLIFDEKTFIMAPNEQAETESQNLIRIRESIQE